MLVREEKGPNFYRAHLAIGWESPSPSGKAGKGTRKRGGGDAEAQSAPSGKRRKRSKFYDAREALPGVDEYGMLLPPALAPRPVAAAAPAQRSSAPAADPRSAVPAPPAQPPAASVPAGTRAARPAGTPKKCTAAATPAASTKRAATQHLVAARPTAGRPTESATLTTAASPARAQGLALPPPPAAVPAAAASQAPKGPMLPSLPVATCERVVGGGSRSEMDEGRKRGKKSKLQKRALTAKGKRAAVLKVVAQSAGATQLAQLPAAAAATATQQAPSAAPPAAATAAAAASQKAPAAVAAVPAEHTRNLGKGWNKADITMLARLATDRAFLQATIPEHPPQGELDWELISKFFGRYSPGGKAVQAQYRLVLRTVKELRHEGRKGVSYVDLVKAALLALPGGRGTVLEVQGYLKQHHSGSLDKYKDTAGTVRWKKAVGEVLRWEKALFEQLGKTPTGKIVWGLKAGAA